MPIVEFKLSVQAIDCPRGKKSILLKFVFSSVTRLGGPFQVP